MQKTVIFAVLFALCCMLSGCFDIFQHITIDNNGVEHNTIKFTISKTIFALAKAADDDTDYEKMIDEMEFDDGTNINTYSQFGAATVEKINTDLNFGVLLDMVINYRDRTVVDKINRDNVIFIPRYNGKNISIHLDFKNYDSEDGSNFMAAAVLAAFNYRLLIDKKCISSINKVIMKTSEEEKEIEFFDLHNEYLIEIPITILFLSAVDIVIYAKLYYIHFSQAVKPLLTASSTVISPITRTDLSEGQPLLL